MIPDFHLKAACKSPFQYLDSYHVTYLNMSINIIEKRLIILFKNKILQNAIEPDF